MEQVVANSVTRPAPEVPQTNRWIWLLILLAAATAGTHWYDDVQSGGSSAATIAQALSGASGTVLQPQAVDGAQLIPRELWSGVVAMIKTAVIAFLLQGMLMLRRREVELTQLIGVAATAGMFMVAGDGLQAAWIAASHESGIRVLATEPLALAWLLPSTTPVFATIYQAANAVNPFDALWCVAIIIGLSRLGVRRLASVGIVIFLWTGLLVIRVVGFWFLNRVLT